MTSNSPKVKDPVEIQLEGRGDLIEAALPHYRALAGVLRGKSWPYRLWSSSSASWVVKNEAAVREALAAASRKQGRLDCPVRSPLALRMIELDALRERLRKRTRSLLGDEAPLAAQLAALLRLTPPSFAGSVRELRLSTGHVLAVPAGVEVIELPGCVQLRMNPHPVRETAFFVCCWCLVAAGVEAYWQPFPAVYLPLVPAFVAAFFAPLLWAHLRGTLIELRVGTTQMAYRGPWSFGFRHLVLESVSVVTRIERSTRATSAPGVSFGTRESEDLLVVKLDPAGPCAALISTLTGLPPPSERLEYYDDAEVYY